MNACALSNALAELLPGMVVTRRRERDWHSATFSGKRIELTLQHAGGEIAQGDWAAILNSHEFSLPDRLVADIAIVREKTVAGGHLLEVEALLLDEEI